MQNTNTCRPMQLPAAKSKTPDTFVSGVFLCNSLAVTYFRMGIHTIIGAEAFHCPVRDGKEWGHLAMAAKLDWLPVRGTREGTARRANWEEVL
jgi:hypothetical protein